MIVLGIETSCDETSVALVDDEGRILSSEISSQVKAHSPYGGVVPEIAAREHVGNFPFVMDQALRKASRGLADVGLVCATAGPGLVGALLVGLSEAKGLALGLGVPFVGVNHIEAHALSPFLSASGEPAQAVPEDFGALVLSGGHSHAYHIRPGRIETLARTRDDAAGEAYDKVAKMAGLGYPGGPIVDRLARGGQCREPFATPSFSDGSLDLSFSGLKTGVRDRLLRMGLEPAVGIPGPEPRSVDSLSPEMVDVLAAFQEAVVTQVLDRVERLQARAGFGCWTVSGGVAANSALRERLGSWGRRRGVEVRIADPALTSDNAAMIAFAGFLRFRRGAGGEGLAARARSRWPLEELG